MEEAQENFDYFMRVRLDRLEYFRNWLKHWFWVTTSLDEKGMMALCDWGKHYACLLIPSKEIEAAYFNYSPEWREKFAGCNIIMDMAIFFGEAIITNCPKLYWRMNDWPLQPNLAKEARRDFGSQLLRPCIAGYENILTRPNPLYSALSYALKHARAIAPQGRRHARQGLLGRPAYRHMSDYGLAYEFRNCVALYPRGAEMPTDPAAIAAILNESGD
jgi:hypothetical protein